MINIAVLVAQAREDGFEGINAEAKVCQDVILKSISESSLNRNVTIKGGVVMREITKDTRRATVDIDLDFIKYSLNDDSIRRFVNELNSLDGISIGIVGAIEELSQQEYRGKRVYIQLVDKEGNRINSKMDLGVHVNMDVEQEEYCFDLCLDEEGASLLINSKEQIFTEKLRSLLRFGPLSTRYKDIFDMYYLSEIIDRDKLMYCINFYIIDEPEMRETSMAEICARVASTFNSRMYRRNIEKARKSNWIQIDIGEVLSELQVYLESLSI